MRFGPSWETGRGFFFVYTTEFAAYCAIAKPARLYAVDRKMVSQPLGETSPLYYHHSG